MLVLAIRTNKPEAEISLFEDTTLLAQESWQGHRELSTTIHIKIEELLKTNHKKLEDIKGIICFKGPGSFTGLRIGLTVGNALAANLAVPIVATMGKNWINDGLAQILDGKDEKNVVPEYGSEAHITQQKR